MTAAQARPLPSRGPRRKEGAPVGPDAVRRAILDAAAELFAQHGVDAVSLRDIASAADVQLVLIARYIGNRAELIETVFHDLSTQLAQELIDDPSGVPSFDRDGTLGCWMTVLNHLIRDATDVGRLAGPFNPVQAIARLAEELHGLEPMDARIRGAQVVALALGWRLFEPYLVAAGDLQTIPIETLRDEYNATNRRIAATPLAAERDAPLRPVEPQPPRPRRATYHSVLANFEREVIRRVHGELRGQDVNLVYARLVQEFHDRLPGDALDERNLWKIAEAIARDTLPTSQWTVGLHG